uniref:Uncharacterized protein n=1 Tax=Arundo donax TaxID=35708 RepID=A0A0A9CVX0_ARUDO
MRMTILLSDIYIRFHGVLGFLLLQWVAFPSAWDINRGFKASRSSPHFLSSYVRMLSHNRSRAIDFRAFSYVLIVMYSSNFWLVFVYSWIHR